MTLHQARFHYLNELHVYCRLRDIGMSKEIAKTLAILLTIKLL